MAARTAAKIPSKISGLVYEAIASDSMGWSDAIKVPHMGVSDVMVRVKSSSLNPFDFRVPENTATMVTYSGKLIGCDVAGEVVATGSKVSSLDIGDEVFGWGNGLADYCVTPANRLAKLPPGLDASTMGVYPCVGVTALQLLRKFWLSRTGFIPDSILIIGSSGGVGSSLIQLCRNFGGAPLQVFGVCSAAHAGSCKSLGANEVFPYDSEKFDISKILPAGSVDLVIDTASGTPECPDYVPSALSLIKPNGKYITLNSRSKFEYVGTRVLQAVNYGPMDHKRQEFFVVDRRNTTNDLEEIAELVQKGKLHIPVVDTVPLEVHALHRAFEKLEQRHMAGKILVRPE